MQPGRRRRAPPSPVAGNRCSAVARRGGDVLDRRDGFFFGEVGSRHELGEHRRHGWGQPVAAVQGGRDDTAPAAAPRRRATPGAGPDDRRPGRRRAVPSAAAKSAPPDGPWRGPGSVRRPVRAPDPRPAAASRARASLRPAAKSAVRDNTPCSATSTADARPAQHCQRVGREQQARRTRWPGSRRSARRRCVRSRHRCDTMPAPGSRKRRSG